MTLLDIKPSTKDIDFIVPNEKEYDYLIKQLVALGYESASGNGWKRKGEVFVFDLFRGKRVHTTELLESPLNEENHRPFKEYSRLYIGVLNPYDLISSKLIRGTRVDFDDCTMLVRARRKEINIDRLMSHCRELASYDISEDCIIGHIDHFMERLQEEGIL